MSGWSVTIRTGPAVERLRARSLGEALDALEQGTRAAATAIGRSRAVDVRVRRFEPAEQVVARGELRGPGRWRPAVHAGLDVRGDGTVQAWTGRLRRERVAAEEGETPYRALRRVLAQSTSVEP